MESQNGGQLCTGSHTGSAHCNTHDCPSPGKLKISITADFEKNDYSIE